MRYGLSLVETIICFLLAGVISFFVGETILAMALLTGVIAIVFMLLLIVIKTMVLGKK